MTGIYRRLGRLLSGAPSSSPYPVTIEPEQAPAKGRVLLSYLEHPLVWPDDDVRLDGHSNVWESREVAQIFCRLGYTVDGVNLKDRHYEPDRPYDVLFDISTNLQRLAPHLRGGAKKILHRTGSDPFYQNQAECERVDALNRRRGGRYLPKRQIAHPELERASIETADACSLIGNDHTLMTYPESLRPKFTLVTVSASRLDDVKAPDDFVPAQREFLWFFGSGAVHKGLDLLLEVFSRGRGLVLNIVGRLESEPDFVALYREELTGLDSIRYHGWLDPNSPAFRDIAARCFCFVAPTCSESISTAVATCTQLGLYPIVSRDTGVTLPDGCGVYLETCEIDEIEETVTASLRKDVADLRREILECQSYALEAFSRHEFSRRMTEFLANAVDQGRDEDA